jgi:hypothetical protein
MIARPEPAAAAPWKATKGATWGTPGLAGVPVVAAGCVLLLLAIDRILRAIAAVKLPTEAMYGEAIIYDQAARLVHGQALYQQLDRSPFTVTAYTPLYYAVVAGLQALGGTGFGPGRILSFGAGLVATILVGRLAARRVGDWRAGLFAGLLFLGLGFPGDYPWFAFYKEDMLGVALSLGAIATLDSGCDRRRAAGAGALAGLAFLSKQTLVAASLTGFGWLWYRNRVSALVFAATALSVGGGVCVFAALTNATFLDNTIRANQNPARVDILVSNLTILGRYQGVPLALALLPVLGRARPWRSWLSDPVVLFWLASLAFLPVGLAKVGSNWNYWIESAAATAVLASCGIWRFALRGGTPRLSRLAALVGLLAVLASPRWLVPPAADLGTVLDRMRQPDQRQVTEFAAVLERVRAEPRGVLSEPLDIVMLAGRDILLEPYIFSILNQQGRWDPAPAVRQICTGQIGLLVLDHRLEGPDWETDGYNHWPTEVLDALRATMQLERSQASLFLYVPVTRPGATQYDPTPVPCLGVR